MIKKILTHKTVILSPRGAKDRASSTLRAAWRLVNVSEILRHLRWLRMDVLLLGVLIFLGGGSVFAAQSYDLKETTPEVQQAIEGRQARYSELQSLKQRGVVGENNQGFVALLKAEPGLDQVVSGENQDRGVLYQAIAAQNQLGPDGISEVKKIFAEVQRGKAQAGDFIQLPSGEWVQK